MSKKPQDQTPPTPSTHELPVSGIPNAKSLFEPLPPVGTPRKGLVPKEKRAPMPTTPCRPPIMRLKKVREDGVIGYEWVEVLEIVKSEPFKFSKPNYYGRTKSSFYDEIHYLCRVPAWDGGLDLHWFVESDLFCELARNGSDWDFEYRVVE